MSWGLFASSKNPTQTFAIFLRDRDLVTDTLFFLEKHFLNTLPIPRGVQRKAVYWSMKTSLAKFNGKIETSHGYSDMNSNTEQKWLKQLLGNKRTAKCKVGEERESKPFQGPRWGSITLIIYLKREGVERGTVKEITALQKKMANFHWLLTGKHSTQASWTSPLNWIYIPAAVVTQKKIILFFMRRKPKLNIIPFCSYLLNTNNMIHDTVEKSLIRAGKLPHRAGLR